MTATLTRPAATTSARLTCLAVAAPLWTTVSLVQAATREGFDLTRHPLSSLSTGSLGWLQIANFVLAGVLILIGAGRFGSGKVVPRLLGVYGVGMIAAGLFPPDAGNGFPAGTPAGPPATVSWHAIGHMAAGSVSFFALIAACYVLARHFARAGRRGDATLSVIAGTALLLGDGWAMSGGPAGSLTLAVGAIAAMLWISVTAISG
ncbi:Protein of unknown function [Amycolatopsis pretoriensis]|uniref:DUF998 domain-containing protein n=1 Tax=Amycolatopsis pretoriensis TaxID=218821 RepID=A0A1H5QCT2_9PSEU|nr:DUF998 domain-containing protein [Amycolatopsis pretoriensis]SEF23912.1 Protein of unknown function [Amycolatopsis pretoriensis]